MVELLCVAVFMAITVPFFSILVAMTGTRRFNDPEWHPSEYQPMKILMARQAAARAERGTVATERLAA